MMSSKATMMTARRLRFSFSKQQVLPILTTVNSWNSMTRTFSSAVNGHQNDDNTASITTTTAASSTVGFIGLGNMGLPMALNLAKANNNIEKVVVYDSNETSCETISKEHSNSIQIADSLESMIVESSPSTILSMLPGDDAVNSVMDIVSTNLMNVESSSKKNESQRMIIIDCSTVSPTTSRYWHDHFWQNGRHAFVDAPVSGGVHGAQLGTLTFMVGKDNEVLQQDEEQVMTILQAMGQRIMECGGPGAGSATKLCNNLALAAQMVGICEAMNLGEALGVDPVVLANVMNTSTAKSWSCEVNNPHPTVSNNIGNGGGPASNQYQGGFGTKLMLKDLGLAVEAGKAAHVALPLGNATKELYQLADLRGLGEKDFGVMLQFLKGNL